MTEEQVKIICKWIVENSNRPLTRPEKELIKQAIDNSKTVDELVSIAIASMIVN